MTGKLASATAALLLALASSSPAGAFERTTTCVEDAIGAYACADGEIPIPIAWSSRCVGYHVGVAGSEDIPDIDTLTATIEASFETWSAVEGSYLELVLAGTTDESRPGYSTCADNVNFIGFIEDDWSAYPSQALALTSITFSATDGVVVDADIEMNSANFTFGILDEGGAPSRLQDLQNTLTHEVGHFIGLNHTLPDTFTGEDPRRYIDATMVNTSPPGETRKRSLHDDDIAGIEAIYPLDRAGDAGACEIPNEGFFQAPPTGPNEECPDLGSTRRRCSVSDDTGQAPPWLLGFGLLVALRLTRSPRTR